MSRLDRHINKKKLQQSTIEAAAPPQDTSNITGVNKRYSKRPQSYGWRHSMFGGEYNPDKLTYRTYDKMLLDPQIEVASLIVQYFLESKKWFITPASEDPKDIEVADFVRGFLENLNMRQIRKEMYTSIDYGYYVGEKILKYDEKQNKIVPSDIIPLDISTIQDCFEYNDDSTVKTVWQSYVEDGPIPIPSWKTLIVTFNERFRNKYGRSKLRTLYDPWFMRDKVIEWLMIYLEKMENPALFGEPGENGSTENLQEFIDNIREGTTGGAGAPGDKIHVIESQHRGETFFTTLNYLDTLIFRSFFIGSLLLGQAEASGSYAQSQTHMDTTQILFDGIHEDQAMDIQNCIVNFFVDLNYNVEQYPKFGFETFTQKDLIGLMNALQPYAQNYLIDVNKGWFEQFIKKVMKQYADIEIDDTDLEKLTNEFPQPSAEDLSTAMPGEHQQLLENMNQILTPTNPQDVLK